MASPVSASASPVSASAPTSSPHHYEFNIAMTCTGCSGAVDRVIKKMEGISSYEVNLQNQTADIHTSTVGYDTLLKKIKGTGKEVKSGKMDGVSMGV